jgi:membrane associated rhomboid family serine protease
MDAPPDRPAAPAGAGAALTLDAGLAPTALDAAGRALLDEHRSLGWYVEIADPGMLGLRAGRGRVALLEYDPAHPFRLLASLERIRRGVYPATHLVVLGADATLRERLMTLVDEPAFATLWLHVVGADASWQNQNPRWRDRGLTQALASAAASAFEPRRWAGGELDAHRGRLLRERERARREARDFEDFRAAFSARRPRATLVLVAVIAVVFALQALWGGVELPPLLTSMGSLVPERLRAGEWWRYLACTFLHGGVLHVALNLLALWMLGRSLERFVGSARFMLIYFAAGLAGSVTSSLFVDTQSVGASGAIWGLLGAEAALAFYPRPLLPPVLVGVARRAAAANLALNLVAAFNPHLDLAAHVGGGLMGAAVLVALAASHQLPAGGRPSPASGPLLRSLAGALALLFAVGLVVAQLVGRPWQLRAAPELVRVHLPGSPWSVTVPRAQSTTVQVSAGSTAFGTISSDPSVVEITLEPLADGTTPLDVARELSAFQRQLRHAPDGQEELMAPRVVTGSGRAGSIVTARYRYTDNPELIRDRAIGILDGVMVTIDVYAWQALPASFEGLADRVLGSLEPAPRASASEPVQRLLFHSGVAHPSRWSLLLGGDLPAIAKASLTLLAKRSGCD